MLVSDAGVQPEKTRGQKLWDVLRQIRDREPVSFQRALLLTDSYRETDGLP